MSDALWERESPWQRITSGVSAWPLEASVPPTQERIHPLPLANVPLPGGWYHSGACRGQPNLLSLFFADVGKKDVVEKAKAICAGCPVVEECREYAVPYPNLRGVWGGLTATERKKLRRWKEQHELPDPVGVLPGP